MYIKITFAVLVYKPDYGSYKSAVRRATVFSLIYQTLLEASMLSEPDSQADSQAIAQHSTASHIISGRAGLSLRFCLQL